MHRERDAQGKKRRPEQRRCLPPLVEAYEAVVVHVDLFEKPGKPPFGHGEPCLLEGRPEFLLAQFAIVIPVNGLEKPEQLALGSLDEDSKF